VEILGERRVTNDFLHCLASLGWPISNNGPDGILALPSAYGASLPYFCDEEVELVYHVASLIPKVEVAHMESHMAQLMGSNRVAILWLQDGDQDLLSLPGKFAYPETSVYLCVIPMTGAGSDGLYRIRIMVTRAPMRVDGNGPAAFTFGPLLDGMVLRREALGPLIRATAISASLFCLYHLSDQGTAVEGPVAVRAQAIQSLARKYEAMTDGSGPMESLYTSLLFPQSEGNNTENTPNATMANKKKRMSISQSAVQEHAPVSRPDIISSKLMSRSASYENMSRSTDSAAFPNAGMVAL